MANLLAGLLGGFSAIGGIVAFGVVIVLCFGAFLLKFFFRMSMAILSFILIGGLLVAFVPMMLVGFLPGGFGGLILLVAIVFLVASLIRNRR